MNAVEQAALREDERDEAPESRVGHRRVLVTLRRGAAAEPAIAMGRVLAGALRASLHGLVLAPEQELLEVADVPEYVGLPEDALHGLVLDVATGDPRQALDEALATQAASCVVVGAAVGASPEERLGLGELAEHALELTCCGVMVVGEVAAPSAGLRRILLPLDGTPSTAAAIEPVGQLAQRVHAELDIVLVGEAHPHGAEALREQSSHAVPGEPGPTPSTTRPDLEPGAMMPPLYVDQPHHEWAAFSEEFVQRFVGNIGHCPRDVPTRFFLGAGEPAAEILRFASMLGSDLLVLVWHGDLSERHGSVFREVLRGAPCPVLVLRR